MRVSPSARLRFPGSAVRQQSRLELRFLVYSGSKHDGDFKPMGIREKRLRKAAKLSQVKLAEKAGVSQPLLSRLEARKDLTSKKLPELARALGVSVHEIDENFAPEDGTEIVKTPLLSWVNAGAIKKPDATVLDLAEAKWVSTVGLRADGEWIALRLRAILWTASPRPAPLCS